MTLSTTILYQQFQELLNISTIQFLIENNIRHFSIDKC